MWQFIDINGKKFTGGQMAILHLAGLATILLPIGLGVSIIAVREYLYQKFVTEMVTNIDNLNVVMNKLVGLPTNVAPQLALKDIVGQLKTAEGIACAVAVLSILSAVAAVIGVVYSKSEIDKKKHIVYYNSKIKPYDFIPALLVCFGGIAIGAKSMFSKMQDFLPTVYTEFSAISNDAVSSGIFLEQFYAKSNYAMTGAIIAGSICVAIGIVALIINSVMLAKKASAIELESISYR